MEFGEIVIHPLEAVTVQEIFRQYISGESYKSLVDSLREQSVPYDQGKCWNKNMVARILENRKYTGVQGWPVIIPEEQYDRANEKRTSKVTPPKKTEAQKVLNRLCRGGPAADAGQVVLQLLNNLIADQEQICTPETPKADTMQINNLSRALKQELERQPVNEDAAKNLALELASARYTGIGDQEYETVRLRRLFGEYTTPMQELDAALLRSAVSAVRMRRCSISILLKNGQIVERSRAL
ncbi:MAG: recombinase family protein [Lawsonibacter sp.]|nr:recombinase family protein [Lawsonibacter sp.]MDE6932335.1 recombinase family protein [Oscillospiraceae bacterium]